MAGLLHKASAFVKRDYLIESSYKLGIVLEVFKTVIPTFSFYFIGKLVAGGEYFPFAMVGVAFSQYLLLSLGAFGDTIRRQQMAGCLEAMLSTRTAPAAVVLLSPIYSFLAKASHIVLVFALGGFFLGVDFSRMNLISCLFTVLLALLFFCALGILSATAILMWKKGDPVTWVVGSFGSLLGGAFFPKDVMPGWMRRCAEWNPMTHALDAMRLALFEGSTPLELLKPYLILGLSAAILLPLSVWCFAMAVEKGRRDGSLLHY